MGSRSTVARRSRPASTCIWSSRPIPFISRPRSQRSGSNATRRPTRLTRPIVAICENETRGDPEAGLLRLAVQQALPLLPLLLGPTPAPSLLDGVDDADQGREDHGRESNEGEGHRSEGRDVEFMTAS